MVVIQEIVLFQKTDFFHIAPLVVDHPPFDVIDLNPLVLDFAVVKDKPSQIEHHHAQDTLNFFLTNYEILDLVTVLRSETIAIVFLDPTSEIDSI